MKKSRLYLSLAVVMALPLFCVLSRAAEPPAIIPTGEHSDPPHFEEYSFSSECAAFLEASGFAATPPSENEVSYVLRLSSEAEVEALVQSFRNLVGEVPSSTLLRWFQNFTSFDALPSEKDILSGSWVIRKFVEDIWDHHQPQSWTPLTSGQTQYWVWKDLTYTRTQVGWIRRTMGLRRGNSPPTAPPPSGLRIVETLHMQKDSSGFVFEIRIKFQGDLSILNDLQINLTKKKTLRNRVQQLLSLIQG